MYPSTTLIPPLYYPYTTPYIPSILPQYTLPMYYRLTSIDSSPAVGRSINFRCAQSARSPY